jgi:choline dehydrogenase-like flavoprotein
MQRDIVVIGSGPIGATVARRLADAGHAVTIFEAGPQIVCATRQTRS